MGSSPWILSMIIVALFSIFEGRELVVAQDTSFVFDYFDCLKDEHIQCTGDSSSTGEGRLNLTGSWMGSIGRVLYLPRIRLLDPATSKVSSFSTNFTFSTQGDYPNPGEGLAFVLLSNPSYVGSGGGFLGVYGQDGNAGTPTLAVEFDTFKNGKSGHFRFNDINDNHVGLDLESIKSIVQVDAGSSGIVFYKESKVTAWVDYHAPTGILQVRISRDSSRPAAPLLSYGTDLSKIFTEYMYVGFSAATGESCFSFHTVLDWGFSSWGIPHDTLPPSSIPPPPPRNPIVPVSAPAPSPFTPPSLNPPRSPIGVPPTNNARPPLSPIVPISAPAPSPFSPPSLNPPGSSVGVPPTNNAPPPGSPILPPTTNAPPPRAPVEGPGSPPSNPGPGVPSSPGPSSPGPAPPTLVPVSGPSSNGTGPGLPTPPPQNDHLPPAPSSTSAPGPGSNSTPPSGPGGSIPPTPGSSDDDTTIRVVVPIVASLGALAALFACCLLFACCRKRKHEDVAESCEPAPAPATET